MVMDRSTDVAEALRLEVRSRERSSEMFLVVNSPEDIGKWIGYDVSLSTTHWVCVRL
jgi:hypothetical protein